MDESKPEDRSAPEVAILHGIRLELRPDVMSDRMISVIRKGSYENGEARQIPKIVDRNERIVELGGGIGFISSLAAKQEKVASVTVYEANPLLIPLIHRNHELNGVRAEVHNAVAQPSAEPAELPFYVRKDFWASSLSPEPSGYQRQINVPVVGFADILERHRPTMLIVDIEGGELELFRKVPLTGIRKIYMELHQKVVGRMGIKSLFDFLSSRDFHYDQHHSQRSVVLFSHVLR
jgi:FkbM family methyltransferase